MGMLEGRLFSVYIKKQKSLLQKQANYFLMIETDGDVPLRDMNFLR